MTRTFVIGGMYVERTAEGLRTLTGRDHAPDVVVCRRVADYPQSEPPAGAGRTTCTRCAAPIAFNPAGPHPEIRKVCMQCAGIAPLEIGRMQ